jgi:hypothetical protein
VIRRSFRRGLALGLLGGAAITAVRTLQRRVRPEPAAPPAWEPIPDTTPVTVPPPTATPEPDLVPEPEPIPPPVVVAEPEPTPVTTPEPDLSPAVNLLQEAPAAPKKKAAPKPRKPKAPWVDPVDGACPGTHPVKGKLSSKIFHVAGGLNYERTVPDRCYLDPAAAEADGLRPSKR